MVNRRFFIGLLGFAFLGVVLAGCGTPSAPPPNTPPVVTTNPTDQTATAGTSVNFTAAASGNPAPTVQWQVSTDGGTTFNNVAGATSATLTFAAALSQSTYKYRAVFTNTLGTATTTASTLTVNTVPMVTIHPADQIVNVGSSVSFTAAASGSPVPTVQWQVSVDGGATFSNYVGAGATSLTLTFTTTAGQNGYKYRAVFTNVAGTATTTAATLTFIGSPAITTQPVSQSVTAGNSVSFTAAASGNPAPTVQWQVSTNGGTTFTSVAGAASPTLTFTTSATQNGNKFRAVFTNIAGTATTTAATLTANPSSVVDVTTYHNDIARTGQNTSEVVLTHANVKSATFGKLGFFATDGLVDAQPLYLSNVLIPNKGTHDVLYVVTENDTVYAFDATTGDVLWQSSALPPGSGETPSDDHGCGQVALSIGITSTPVIDRARGPNGAIYLVAMSKKGSTYFQRLHALDLTTGAELHTPTTIQATYPGTGDHTDGTNVIFDPGQYKERTGLLLLPNGPNGTIYTAWASHCDFRPYTGWIMAFDATSLAQTSVLNVTPNGNEGAIWQSGAGLAADSSGNIYFLDGNGTFDPTLTAGFPTKGDFGNAFLKLSTSGGLAVADYFEMFNQAQENGSDQDLGSGGGLVLLDLKDSGQAVHHLAVGAGKDTNIYVVDRDSMGKFSATSNNIYQEIDGIFQPGPGVFSMPAYFNNTIYFGAVDNPIKAFGIANAMLSTTPSSHTGASFSYPGATPGVSANGTTNAILWAVENTGASSGGGSGVLHAYDAANLATELYNSNTAVGGRDHFLDNKFITPTIANGKVYVGTPSGVIVFGLL